MSEVRVFSGFYPLLLVTICALQVHDIYCYMRLPYYEVHPGEGPYALFVHGFLSSRAQWLPNLDRLSTVCRPVVVELFGHGRSTSPAEPEGYLPDKYLLAFEEIRANLGASHWFLIGQSLGAGLTLRYALQHPARVVAHVLTNSSTAFSDQEWLDSVRPGTDRMIELAKRKDRGVLERIAVHPKNARHLAVKYKQALCDDAALHDPLGASYTARYTSLTDPIDLSSLKGNRVPTLLVCGTRESRFMPRRQFAEKNLNQLEVFEVDAGHAVNIEAPEMFNRAVIEFFTRHATKNEP